MCNASREILFPGGFDENQFFSIAGSVPVNALKLSWSKWL